MRDSRLELTEAARSATHPAADREPSIAVLPFAHASGTDDEYFAEGVAEEILNALGQLDGLRVAARSSSFTFKGRHVDLRQVGEQLHVVTVLEGSVRRVGTRLRITARLVNVADGYELWSERYDRELTDVFEVQDEIAHAIADRLKLTLQGGGQREEGRPGTSNLEAYDYFLKGRSLQNQRGQFIYEALRCFEQALDIDPQYTDALGWMSDSYRLIGTYGMAPFHHVMPKAKAAAERALAIDPDSVEALVTLADVLAQYDRAYSEACRLWERVLELDPRHTRARGERALWALGFGEFRADRAVAEAEQAVADDPLSSWALSMLSLVRGLAGQHEESITAAGRAVEIDPNSYFAQWSLMRSHAWAGRNAVAVDLASPVLGSSGRHIWTLATLAYAYAGLGKVDLARAVYDELEARSRMEFVSPAWFAAVAVSAGLTDEALRLLERGFDERDPFLLLLRVMPFWAGLRDRPRFVSLAGQMGFRDA